jgi:hypothetical protein
VLHGAHIVRNPLSANVYLSNGNGKPMRVILDGVDTDGDLDELTGLDIESVEVLKFVGTTGAYSGFALPTTGVYKNGYEGILVVNSNRHTGLQAKEITSIGILPIHPKGFYKAREFYSPKYDNISSQASSRPDLRSTIYWNPELVTDNSGTASFEYYNADSTGNYRVVIEGIDDKGNLGRWVYRYKVE